MERDLHEYIRLCKEKSFSDIQNMYNSGQLNYMKSYTLDELHGIYNSYHIIVGGGKLKKLLKTAQNVSGDMGDIASLVGDLKDIKGELSNLIDDKLDKLVERIIKAVKKELKKEFEKHMDIEDKKEKKNEEDE